MYIFILKAAIVCIGGYLLGSANTSLIVGKFYRVDVRKHGSGNAGATNTLRTLGKSAAIMVSVGDILKGLLACIAGILIIGEVNEAGYIGKMLGGIFAIIGHNWPVYFNFKGGKGVFTSLAVVFMMDWRIGLILLAVFVAVVAATRYVSLGSVLGAAIFPIASLLSVFDQNIYFTVFACIIALLVIIRHRSNIVRIFKGTESKLGVKAAN